MAGAPARTFRIGFLFLALVTTATYTANLAAFLTQPNLQIHGPRNMEELRSAVACVEYDEVAPTLGSLVAGTMSPDSEAPGEFGYGDIEARSAFCVDRVTAGDADIYISNDVNVHLAGLGGNCDKLHQPTGIQLGPFHLYAATRDPALARNVSRSMDALYTYSSLYEVFDARYKRSETCAEESAGETTQIKVKDMRGLFVIFAVISAAAVAAAAWEASAALRRSDNAAQSTDHLESMADAIRRLEGKLDEALAREDKIGAAIFDKLRVDAARPSAGNVEEDDGASAPRRAPPAPWCPWSASRPGSERHFVASATSRTKNRLERGRARAGWAVVAGPVIEIYPARGQGTDRPEKVTGRRL